MKNIVVFGCGGHAKVVIDIIEKMNEYKIIGIIDSSVQPESIVCGYKVLGKETMLSLLDIDGGIVAIGDNFIRSQVVNKIKQIIPEFRFITVVHPQSIIARGVQIGNGTAVMAGSIINSESSIGEHCIINTKASVDHDCKIGHFTSLAPGCTLGGNVKIGEQTAISIGATIIHGKKIGDHSVIGAGATVLNDIESYSVAYGTPAKKIRTREMGEKYM